MDAMTLTAPRFRRARRFLPAAAYYAIIFYLSSRSKFPVESPFSGFDLLAHVGLFGLLGLLLGWALLPPGGRGTLGRAGWAVGLGLLAGVADECHQLFVPGRNADVWDAAADVLGVAVGVGLSAWLARRARRAGRG